MLLVVLELQALQKNDAATAQRLLNSQADSQRNSGDFSQKVNICYAIAGIAGKVSLCLVISFCFTLLHLMLWSG